MGTPSLGNPQLVALDWNHRFYPQSWVPPVLGTPRLRYPPDWGTPSLGNPQLVALGWNHRFLLGLSTDYRGKLMLRSWSPYQLLATWSAT